MYFYAKDQEGLNNRTDMIKYIDGNGMAMFVPNDSANKDWQEYQAWLAADENNIPQEET